MGASFTGKRTKEVDKAELFWRVSQASYPSDLPLSERQVMDYGPFILPSGSGGSCERLVIRVRSQSKPKNHQLHHEGWMMVGLGFKV